MSIDYGSPHVNLPQTDRRRYIKKRYTGKKKTCIQRVSEGGDDNDSETKTELTRLHVIEEELPRYPGTPQQVSQKELNCV